MRVTGASAGVAVYLRWSTEEQGSGTTLPVQLQACRDYLRAQDWTFDGRLLFIDDGYSGATLQRPALGRLRQAVQGGAVHTVVVYKLDRLARSVRALVRLVLEEWDGRCTLRAAGEPVDTLSPGGRLFFCLLASYAEWERASLLERTLAGKRRRAAEGRNPGMRLPFGYRPPFRPELREAAVVRLLFAWYAAGRSARAITRSLNEAGVPFRTGLWRESTVKQLLASPIYAGELRYGRRPRSLAGALAAEGQAVCGAVSALVPRRLWEQVQALRQLRPAPGRRASGRTCAGTHLLTGLLRCGQCGSGLAGSVRGRHRYYECLSHRLGRGGCPARRLRQESLDALVVERLLALCPPDLTSAAGIRVYDEATIAGATLLRRAQGRLENRRRRAGAPDVPEAVRRALDAEATRLAECERRLAPLAAACRMPLPLLAAPDAWRLLPVTDRKALLRHFLHELILTWEGAEPSLAAAWRVRAAP
jgi:site-specific DNA recombinase